MRGTAVIVRVWQKPRQAKAVPIFLNVIPLILYGTESPTAGILTE